MISTQVDSKLYKDDKYVGVFIVCLFKLLPNYISFVILWFNKYLPFKRWIFTKSFLCMVF